MMMMNQIENEMKFISCFCRALDSLPLWLSWFTCRLALRCRLESCADYFVLLLNLTLKLIADSSFFVRFDFQVK